MQQGRFLLAVARTLWCDVVGRDREIPRYIRLYNLGRDEVHRSRDLLAQ